ncbi:hypothetical protein ACO1O0_006457 [Amphichorda felina]
MPSHQKPLPNSGRRAEPAQDPEQALRDAITTAQTELNKVVSEKDRLETACEHHKRRAAESANNVLTLRSQLQSVTEDRDSYKKKYQQQNALNEKWIQSYQALEAKYNDLLEAYDEINSSSGSSPNTSVTDRSKEARSSAKRDDRGRTRDGDREREKREKREQKAEKERLSKRFEDRRPPPSNRRSSFIEGWGPGGRSASANPHNRTQYPSGSSGRTAPLSPPHGAQYGGYAAPNVPRSNPNPLSPSGVYSSGSSAVYDEDHEDGNYRPYPIPR